MGKKISVDSSTFANKVLELFEAKILFQLPNNKLGIKIESRSNTHAIINCIIILFYQLCTLLI